MSCHRTVAAFRAWQWNADIAGLASRFFAACPGARHVVLLNETDGRIDIGEHEKVSHDSDFSGFGLPELPAGKSLWYNGDYAYIFLRQALPDYDHYIISESDVAVNLSLEPMVLHASRNGLDAIMHKMAPCDPNWAWYQAALAQPDPWSAGLFIAVFSGRALDTLLNARQLLARRRAAGQLDRWPIVESFVPTALREAGLRCAEIAIFADVANLSHRPHYSLHDPRAGRAGALVHPVLGSRDLARALLASHPVQDYHRDGTALHTALRREKLSDIADIVLDGFARDCDHVGRAGLLAEMRLQGIAGPDHADLAFCKPATVSSVCIYSRSQDRWAEAAGANGVVQHEECAFHTDCESDAWWMVDLLDECVVEQVDIVNRGGFGDRFRHFAIESSRNGSIWRTRYVKQDDVPVSGDLALPWSLPVDDPFLARYVRIRRLGEPGFLHLRRIRLFGRVVGAAVTADGFSR